MKPTYTLFLCLFLSALFLSEKTNAQFQGDYTFAIHIGTFVKAKSSDFDNIKPLGFVYAEKFRNNLLQIYLGEFSSEASASPILNQVKAKGYPDAYVMRRNLQQGEKVYIIQLDTKRIGQTINWQEYLKAGPLFAVLEKDQIKVMTGVFDHGEEANQRLDIVNRLGYPNAKVSPINNIYLHAISPFEAGGNLVAPEVELVVEAPVAAEPKPDIIPITVITPPVVTTPPVKVPAVKPDPKPIPEVVSTSKVEKTSPPPVEMIPDSYDEVLTSRSPEVVEAPKVVEPDIRLKVKRTSAIELQKVLKKERTYTGSLDGYYGNGTKGAYAQYLEANPYINKYKILAQQQDQWTTKGGNQQDDLFREWQSLQLLHQIAYELDPNPVLSENLAKSYAAIRAKLYQTKQALSVEEQKAIIAWNTSLWIGLDAWTAKDPIHQKMTTPLRVVYYQSMVLLEDYFMNKNFKPLEAKGLALSVLQTMVAPYLESYRL